jgi:hypothetical protein
MEHQIVEFFKAEICNSDEHFLPVPGTCVIELLLRIALIVIGNLSSSMSRIHFNFLCEFWFLQNP